MPDEAHPAANPLLGLSLVDHPALVLHTYSPFDGAA